MPHEPKPAKENRTDPPPRQNAQADHEGSADTPDAFNGKNLQKQTL